MKDIKKRKFWREDVHNIIYLSGKPYILSRSSNCDIYIDGSPYRKIRNYKLDGDCVGYYNGYPCVACDEDDRNFLMYMNFTTPVKYASIIKFR